MRSTEGRAINRLVRRLPKRSTTLPIHENDPLLGSPCCRATGLAAFRGLLRGSVPD